MSTAARATTERDRDLRAGSWHAGDAEGTAEGQAAEEHSGSSEGPGQDDREHSDGDHRENVIEAEQRVGQAVPQSIGSASDMGK